MGIKKGLTIEEAFKALNLKPILTEGDERSTDAYIAEFNKYGFSERFEKEVFAPALKDIESKYPDLHIEADGSENGFTLMFGDEKDVAIDYIDIISLDQAKLVAFIEKAIAEDNIKIVKVPVQEWIKKSGSEPGDYDWDDGRKAKFIYTDKEEISAQVGIELEDGSFAVVGLANDHMCDDYEHMVQCIKRYM